MTAHHNELPAPEASQYLQAMQGDQPSSALTKQLLDECYAMARYALSHGLDVKPATIQKLQTISTHHDDYPNDVQGEKLTDVHQTLVAVVSPATPVAITLMHRHAHSGKFALLLGPVPLVRRLTVTAIIFLLGLMSVSMSGLVNTENLNAGLLSSHGDTLAINQLFLICCSGLGSSFSALFQVNTFIANATYDPRFDSSYWSRIILGMIAGIIIVELLPEALFQEGAMKDFGKPSLAMLSGFSVTVVYRILQRLVDTMQALVKGRN